MKRLFPVLLTLLFALPAFPQQFTPCVSLTAGTDFHNPISMWGMEWGAFTADRKHGLLLITEVDRIVNADLYKYHLDQYAKPGTTMSHDSYSLGLKYVFTAVRIQDVSLQAVVHPWYSVNMRKASGYIGGRLSIRHKGDAIAVELAVDPIVKRVAIRFVGTAFFK
jgi:hypothetical protein